MSKNIEEFIQESLSFPEELTSKIFSHKEELDIGIDGENYNTGVNNGFKNMQQPPKVCVATAEEFEKAYRERCEKFPEENEIDTKAHIAFDFLQKNGSPMTFEQNADEILFGDINRKTYLASKLYDNVIGNTDYVAQHIGDMKVVFSKPKSGELPKGTEGLSEDILEQVDRIPAEERDLIFFKRGFYHEAVHACLGTKDERKCDAFALLKVMQEHPEHAQTVFDVYNMARSKTGYLVHNTLKGFEASERNGTLTYLMPNTYKQLEKYAKDPSLIPDGDLEIMKLTCELTKNPEFEKEDLEAFKQLMSKTDISKQDLNENPVIRACMRQGGFKSIDEYIENDKSLGESVCDKTKRKALSFDEIVSTAVLPPPYASQETTDRKTITPEEQRRELANIACLISRGHTGYLLWNREVTKQFEEAIADLYNSISENLDLKNKNGTGFYNKLDKALQILPDEHLKVSPGKGNLIPREPENKTSVGENSCPEKPWSIKQSEDGKSTILTISDLGSTNPKDWLDLQQTVQRTLFKEDGSENCDSLIIDVRGNPGGPSIPYERIAKMLYGNEVAPFEKSVYRDMPENDYLRCANGEISKEEYEYRKKYHQYTGEMVTVCDYTDHEKDFPPFVSGGFKKPITLLTDRKTASAGESLCQLLKGHPGLTIAGENTAGCYAENSGDCARNKFNYGVKIGTSHVFVRDGHSCEKQGFSVDFKTNGQDALTAVQKNMDKINADAQKRLDAYTPPKKAKNNRNDQLAFNDMMFIRELNRGNIPEEQLRGLYNHLFPDSSEKFDKILQAAPTGLLAETAKNQKDISASQKSNKKNNEKETAYKLQKAYEMLHKDTKKTTLFSALHSSESLQSKIASSEKRPKSFVSAMHHKQKDDNGR